MTDISWKHDHGDTKDQRQKQMKRHQNRFKNEVHSVHL